MRGGREVTLPQMLSAREWRAGRQRALLESCGGPVLSLTLNMPGPIKRFALAEVAFAHGKRLIESQLGSGCSLAEERMDDAGCWALYALSMDALEAKARLSAVEESHPIGRMLDIDIIGANGRRIGRGEVGFPARKCLLCDEDAHICARSRAHPVESLQRAAVAALRRFNAEDFANAVGCAAVRALQSELDATPKPGLVDRRNRGAHTDLNYELFTKSIAAIGSHFRDCALSGILARDSLALYRDLKDIGLRAESDMMAATGGVNTHRGAIFALGVVAAGCGRLYGGGGDVAADGILREAAGLGSFFIDALMRMPPGQAASHGERAFAQTGALGARGEAARGYPSVGGVALPALRHYLGLGASENDAGVAALLMLVGELEDTNLITRAGAVRARAVREDVGRRVANAGGQLPRLMELAAELDGEFIAQNLSPGGCADLLAVAYFLNTIENQPEGAW